MVTMRMCWCVRSRDAGVLYPTPKKAYFSPWLFYDQRISCMPRLFIMPDPMRAVSCIVHRYPVRLIWHHVFFRLEGTIHAYFCRQSGILRY
jgi:hypothetical protein